MLEILVAGSLVAGLVLTTVRGPSQRRSVVRPATIKAPMVDLGKLSFEGDDRGADLPCPWCLAPTRETDERCPSCGQRFG